MMTKQIRYMELPPKATLTFLKMLDEFHRKTGDTFEIINKVDKIIIRRTIK